MGASPVFCFKYVSIREAVKVEPALHAAKDPLFHAHDSDSVLFTVPFS